MNAPWSARVANSNRVMSEMAKAVAVLRELSIAFLAFRESLFRSKATSLFDLDVREVAKGGAEFLFHDLARAARDGGLCGGLKLADRGQRGTTRLASYDRGVASAFGCDECAAAAIRAAEHVGGSHSAD